MKLRYWLAACGFAALCSGCVSKSAGYDDVRSLTSQRLGKRVRWHEHDSRRKSDGETRKLLAAPLTADSAVQIALLNNESVQAAFETLGVARGELVHALRLPNPEVGAALRFGGDERPEIDIDATLSLTQLLFMPSRNGVARAAFDAAKLEVAGSAIDLAFETRLAFFDHQAAAQQLELRHGILGSLRASRDMTQKLHEAGNVTDLNLASQRALYEEARIAYARARAKMFSEREKLNALMGLWGEDAARWKSVARLAEPQPVDDLLRDIEAKVLSKSLDLEISRRRFRRAARRANLSEAEGWLPDLRAGVSAERAESGWGVGPLAEIEVPLFYQGQGETAQALAEMRRERKLYASTAVRLRARARGLAVRLASAAKSAQYYKSTLLPLREEVVKQTQLEYNAMSVGVFQLLQAKRDQIAAAQAYVDLMHEYWTLRAETEQLLAGRLPKGASGAESMHPDIGSSSGPQAEAH